MFQNEQVMTFSTPSVSQWPPYTQNQEKLKFKGHIIMKSAYRINHDQHISKAREAVEADSSLRSMYKWLAEQVARVKKKHR